MLPKSNYKNINLGQKNMLKSLFSRKLPILLLTTLTSVLPFNTVNASVFDETEVNQEEFIAVAQPFGEDKYNLIVIQQIPGKNSCWQEMSATSNLVNVDLLLMNFDFTGHCRRSTDANGYSIRYDDKDYGLDYLLSLVEKDGELLLLGTNRMDRSQPPIVVGSSEGLSDQPMKIKLNPGWRFTKRTYQDKVLGHVYFSYDSASAPTVDEGMNSSETLDNVLEQQPLNEDMNLEATEENANEDTMLPDNRIREIVAPQIQTEENANEDMMLPDDRVREILAPQSFNQQLKMLPNERVREILLTQSNKQLKKSDKIAPITQNSEGELIEPTIELR